MTAKRIGAATLLALVALVAAGCEEGSGPVDGGLSPAERAFIEEIATEAALDGLFVATQSYEGGFIASHHVGLAQSLPGVPAGLLGSHAVTEFGEGVVNCEDWDPPEAWRSCTQVTMHEEGWAEGVVFLPAAGESLLSGMLTYDSEQTETVGELRYDPVPAARWVVDFRASASPAVLGSMEELVIFVPSGSGPELDLSHTGSIEVSSLDPEVAVMQVTIEFSSLNACGIITIQIQDDGHEGVGGTVSCEGVELAAIVPDDETFYSFVWVEP